MAYPSPDMLKLSPMDPADFDLISEFEKLHVVEPPKFQPINRPSRKKIDHDKIMRKLRKAEIDPKLIAPDGTINEDYFEQGLDIEEKEATKDIQYCEVSRVDPTFKGIRQQSIALDPPRAERPWDPDYVAAEEAGIPHDLFDHDQITNEQFRSYFQPEYTTCEPRCLEPDLGIDGSEDDDSENELYRQDYPSDSDDLPRTYYDMDEEDGSDYSI